jgi:hypothetical protein
VNVHLYAHQSFLFNDTCINSNNSLSKKLRHSRKSGNPVDPKPDEPEPKMGSRFPVGWAKRSVPNE